MASNPKGKGRASSETVTGSPLPGLHWSDWEALLDVFRQFYSDSPSEEELREKLLQFGISGSLPETDPTHHSWDELATAEDRRYQRTMESLILTVATLREKQLPEVHEIPGMGGAIGPSPIPPEFVAYAQVVARREVGEYEH